MYKEVFYWSHYYIVKYIKVNKEPIESAYFAVCLLMYINISTFMKIIEIFTGFQLNISNLEVEDKYTLKALYSGLMLTCPYFVFNYFYVYRKSRREKIFAYYGSLSQKRQKKGKTLFLLYVIFSIFFLFYIGYRADRDIDVPIKQELNFDNFPSPR